MAFNTAAVMFPPNPTAPLKVTKSPVDAPWDVSVTVITAEPFVATKGLLLIVLDARKGVMS